MTIQSDTAKNSYIGTGSSDTFVYTFKVINAADLLVVEADAEGLESELQLGVDFTVTGVKNTAGGNVILTAGNLAEDHVLVIRRRVDIVQETSIRNQGPYYAAIHEDTFDYGRMIDIQQQEEIDRSLKFKPSVTPLPSLPIEPPEPDSVLVTNGVPNALVWQDRADFIGPEGPEGPEGQPGEASVWYTGSGAPDPSLGVENDMYLDDDNGDVYKKVSDTWGIVANIEGPQGATGPTGFGTLYGTPLVPSGTDQDVDYDDGELQTIDLGSASGDVTLTFSNPGADVRRLTLFIIQGATPRAIIWPVSVLWPNNEAPVLLQGNDSITKIELLWDGVSAYYGNFPYPNFDLTGSIVDSDINSSAAIAGSKIDPDFGSQDIKTTGGLSFGGALIADSLLDNTSTGANAQLADPANFVVEVSDSSLASIGSIVAPAGVKAFVLINRTGSAVDIVDSYSSATAANRILTGTGSDVELNDNASLFLVYSDTESRWQVVGGSGGGSLPNFTDKEILFGDGTGVPVTNGELQFDLASGDNILSVGANSSSSDGQIIVGGSGSGTGKITGGGGALQIIGGPLSVDTHTASQDITFKPGTALSLTLDTDLNASFAGTGALKVHSGSDAERPGTPVNGMFRYNTEGDGGFEGYVNGSWGPIGGGGGGGLITSVSDTDSIDLTENSGDLTADLNLSAASADSGHINAVNSIESDGLQTQVPILVGDSGSGGAAGVAPAPGSGDAAANKFLKADGSWSEIISNSTFSGTSITATNHPIQKHRYTGSSAQIMGTITFSAMPDGGRLIITSSASSENTLTINSSPSDIHMNGNMVLRPYSVIEFIKDDTALIEVSRNAYNQ